MLDFNAWLLGLCKGESRPLLDRGNSYDSPLADVHWLAQAFGEVKTGLRLSQLASHAPLWD